TPVAAVTVNRTGSSAGTASATVNLTNGTAIAPGDYNNAPIPVNFAAGETTKTIVVPIVDDALVEGDETVNLSLTNPTGATIGTQSTATLNIIDNDDPVPTSTLQFSAPTFRIREDGTAVAAVTVNRTGDRTAAVSATVNLADGTAVAPDDYGNSPIVVNFAAGDNTPKTIEIPVVDDTLVERNETVNLSLANPTGGARIGAQSTATMTIVDNDSTIEFSDPFFSVNEDGTPVAAVTVTRTGRTVGAVSAIVNLTDGTAIAGRDYINGLIAVNFAAGDNTPKVINIPIIDDTLVERTETINLRLVNPTGNATIGTQRTAVLTIIDNDTAPAPIAPPGGLTASSLVSDDPITNFAEANPNNQVSNVGQNGIGLQGSTDIQNGDWMSNFTNSLGRMAMASPGTSSDVGINSTNSVGNFGATDNWLNLPKEPIMGSNAPNLLLA
ncbi:Calx-beta domain-containing protein, partial [Tychonema sp. LEGE 07203]|uniref:Calx-beta domain-containing protein n=1 Tax=Tychonema sp. LEGE 07203 TaxID=1828671 RepID=UPI0019E7C0AA